MSEYGNDLVVLTDEDGNEEEFEHIDTIEHNSMTYMAFVSTKIEGSVESDEESLVLLKLELEDDEEILVTIQDEDELDDVSEIFYRRLENWPDEEDDALGDISYSEEPDGGDEEA